MVSAIKVVVVDDNQSARSLIRRLLELAGGFEVIAEAGNGAEAVAACRRLDPEVVVMDSQMPVMDGFEATSTIKAENPMLSVIMVSSFGGPEIRRLAEQAGADRFLDKEEVVGEICRAAAILGRKPVEHHLPEYPGESPAVQ